VAELGLDEFQVDPGSVGEAGRTVAQHELVGRYDAGIGSR
jgi:hypothetical protein